MASEPVRVTDRRTESEPWVGVSACQRLDVKVTPEGMRRRVHVALQSAKV